MKTIHKILVAIITMLLFGTFALQAQSRHQLLTKIPAKNKLLLDPAVRKGTLPNGLHIISAETRSLKTGLFFICPIK